MTQHIPEAPPVLDGERVFRIHWVLGTDQLRAVCHCGAAEVFDDPTVLWDWLLAHPDGHDSPAPAHGETPTGSDDLVVAGPIATP